MTNLRNTLEHSKDPTLHFIEESCGLSQVWFQAAT